MAGTDEDRIADLNEAFRDPGVRAVFATRGGKGAYRISHRLDFEAAARDPKPLIGFSDITILHLALWQRCGLVGIHGHPGADGARDVLTTFEPVVVKREPSETSAAVTAPGTATGFLMGGNLGTIRSAIGSDLPSLDGAILLIEDFLGTGLGQIDRELTQLMKAGALKGLRGVAVGQLLGFELLKDESLGGWSIVDVLNDRLGALGVPVLGGLPIGHGPRSSTVPLGTSATIDTDAGVLTVEPGVT